MKTKKQIETEMRKLQEALKTIPLINIEERGLVSAYIKIYKWVLD